MEGKQLMDWGYQRESSKIDAVKGKRRCVIVDVEEGTSKSSGLPMITITVRPSGTKFKVKTYLVKNDNFNKNATSFFDAFPEIEEGDFNFISWIGCEGAAEFGEDDQGYTKLKWFLNSEKSEGLPPFEGEKPERQTVTKIEEEPLGEDEDLPWV